MEAAGEEAVEADCEEAAEAAGEEAVEAGDKAAEDMGKVPYRFSLTKSIESSSHLSTAHRFTKCTC